MFSNSAICSKYKIEMHFYHVGMLREISWFLRELCTGCAKALEHLDNFSAIFQKCRNARDMKHSSESRVGL